TRIIIKRSYSSLYNEEPIKIYNEDFVFGYLDASKEMVLELPCDHKNVIYLQTAFQIDSITYPGEPYHSYYYNVKLINKDNHPQFTLSFEKEVKPLPEDTPENFYIQKGLNTSLPVNISMAFGLCNSYSLKNNTFSTQEYPDSTQVPFKHNYVSLEFTYLTDNHIGVGVPLFIEWGNRNYFKDDTTGITEENNIFTVGPAITYRFVSNNKRFIASANLGIMFIYNSSYVKSSISYSFEDISYGVQGGVKFGYAFSSNMSIFIESRAIKDFKQKNDRLNYDLFFAGAGLGLHF
ncbi:MAG: porin family protein, partial [Bacteroidales bacterium]|nr:porin family protein [Bacteroidales bacterium]